MTVNMIHPEMLGSQAQFANEKAEPRITTSNGTRDVPDQTQKAQAGKVTSAEKISNDVKKNEIDPRKREAGKRPDRPQHLDTEA